MISEYFLLLSIIFVAPVAGLWIFPGKRWPDMRTATIAIGSVAIPFIVWDMNVTGTWWNFNRSYTSGIFFGPLPIEEILFFLVVPWSCLVLWVNLPPPREKNFPYPIEAALSLASIAGAVVLSIRGTFYTSTVLFVFGILILISISHGRLFTTKRFLCFSLFVILFTTIFNGYLTYRPIVTYSPDFVSGIRIGTIPIEDYLYGFLLTSSVTLIYERLTRRTR